MKYYIRPNVLKVVIDYMVNRLLEPISKDLQSKVAHSLQEVGCKKIYYQGIIFPDSIEALYTRVDRAKSSDKPQRLNFNHYKVFNFYVKEYKELREQREFFRVFLNKFIPVNGFPVSLRPLIHDLFITEDEGFFEEEAEQVWKTLDCPEKEAIERLIIYRTILGVTN